MRRFAAGPVVIARGKLVVSAVGQHLEARVKSAACLVWTLILVCCMQMFDCRSQFLGGAFRSEYASCLPGRSESAVGKRIVKRGEPLA